METPNKILTSEQSCKFYDPSTLTPVYEVDLKKPVKQSDGTVRTKTKATKKHMRDMGLIPSLTFMIKEGTVSYELELYKMGQVIKACVVNPPPVTIINASGDIVEEVLKSYAEQMMAKADEFKDFTAQRGKQIHADLERWIMDRVDPTDPVSLAVVHKHIAYWKSIGAVKVLAEQTFGSKELGFGFTADWIAETAEGVLFVGDLKTTDLEKYKSPYDSWKDQLGGERFGLAKLGKNAAHLVQSIADRNTGDVRFVEYTEEEMEKWTRACALLIERWHILND